MKKYLLGFAFLLGLLLAHGESFRVDNLDYLILNEDMHDCMLTVSSEEPYSGDITIPAEVTFDNRVYNVIGIDEYSFAGCENLISVTIPESVCEIGRNAFQSCYSLSEIVFPDAVEKVEDQTFYSCSSLTSFEGHGITIVGESAFSNCVSVTDLIFSEELSFIGESAFKNCRMLQEFSFEYVESFGIGAFSGCSSLLEVTLPGSMTVLPEAIFSDCVSLLVVNNTSGLVEIGDYAFSGCSSLQYFETNPDLSRIGRNAFSYCADLELTQIEGAELSIGDYAFSGCGSLQNLILSGVASIGEETFANAIELQSIYLGESLMSIERRAFRNCNELILVRSEAKQPPLLDNNSFDEATYSRATLEVRASAELRYRQTPPWLYFNEIIPYLYDDDSVDDISLSGFEIAVESGVLRISGPAGKLSVYTLDGVCISNTMKGNEDINIPFPQKGIVVVSLGSYRKKIWL